MTHAMQHLCCASQKSLGLAFSFLIYYGLPFHHRTLTQIYAPFVRPGDLCFDIGAHLGDRLRAWSKLGALGRADLSSRYHAGYLDRAAWKAGVLQDRCGRAELAVPQGLSQPLPALSFEYIPVVIETALGCIERLSRLGDYEYNWRVSEFPWLRSAVWLNPQEMTTRLRQMRRDSNSGDVYARLIRT
jgi:hypothetical protein